VCFVLRPYSVQASANFFHIVLSTTIITSDGIHVVRFIEPENFQTVRSIAVFRENGLPLMNLNELEYINDEIWANIWHSENINLPNHIARIDPKKGKLLGWINLEDISSDEKHNIENTLMVFEN
jgi:glutamine cyclotransferase